MQNNHVAVRTQPSASAQTQFADGHAKQPDRLAWIPAVGVLIFAWWLFITNINLESMWYDEFISWSLADSPDIFALFGKYPFATGHPPGYFVWLFGWMKWSTHHSMLVLRLSATIPAMIAAALVYRLGYEWFRGRWVALGALVFFVTSSLLVYYTRELRMYTFLIALVLISWWLLDRYVKATDRRRWGYLVGYAVVVALMGLTHYLSALIALSQLVVMLIFHRRQVLPLLGGYLLTTLLIAPWLPTFYAQASEASKRAGHSGELAIDTIGQFDATEPTTLDNIAEFVELYAAQQIMGLTLLLVIAVLIGLSWRNPRWYRQRVGWAVGWLAVVVIAIFTFNLVVPLYNPRYILTIIPALALLVGIAVDQIPARARLALVAVIAVSGIVTHTNSFKRPKLPHHEILTTIDAGFMPGDRIWYNLNIGALGSNLEHEVRYYLRHITPQLTPEDFIWDAPDDFRELDPAVRVWDVRPYWNPMPSSAEDPLTAERVRSEKYSHGDWGVRLYESLPGDQSPAEFGDRFALLTGQIPPAYQPGDSITTKLWWRALRPSVLDYSMALQLRDRDGQVIDQIDTGLVVDEDTPTSQWFAEDEFMLGMPVYTLPADLPPGSYELWIGAYYWEDPTPLPVEADRRTDADNFIHLYDITVE